MILISDKDEEMRSTLQSQLGELGVPCALAANGREVRAQVSGGQVQVWVADAILADTKIDDMVREVRANSPKTQILILIPALTSDSQNADLARWLEAGANDFLVKPFERATLVRQVKSLIRRLGLPRADSDQSLSMGELVLNPANFDVYCGSERTPLTPNEFKLLHALMLRQGTVLSRDQLIALVQGAGIAVVDRAVDTHVASLRKKLGKCSEWIETVRGVGYRLKSSS